MNVQRSMFVRLANTIYADLVFVYVNFPDVSVLSLLNI